MTDLFRIVCDTNVIISAALSAHSIPRKVINTIKDRSILLVSEETTRELKDVLMRNKFDRYLSRQERIDFLKSFFSDSEYTRVHSIVTDCSDPKDYKFLELAIDGDATHIISGDSDLLEMNPFGRIKIITPSDFLRE